MGGCAFTITFVYQSKNVSLQQQNNLNTMRIITMVGHECM